MQEPAHSALILRMSAKACVTVKQMGLSKRGRLCWYLYPLRDAREGELCGATHEKAPAWCVQMLWPRSSEPFRASVSLSDSLSVTHCSEPAVSWMDHSSCHGNRSKKGWDGQSNLTVRICAGKRKWWRRDSLCLQVMCVLPSFLIFTIKRARTVSIKPTAHTVFHLDIAVTFPRAYKIKLFTVPYPFLYIRYFLCKFKHFGIKSGGMDAVTFKKSQKVSNLGASLACKNEPPLVLMRTLGDTV